MKFFVCIFFIIILFSCQQATETVGVNNSSVIEDIHNCTSAEDTVLANGYSIKYALKDSVYDVLVNINGISKWLGYGIKCDIPNGLIPKYLMHNSSQLFLVSGSGQHSRNMIVCTLNNDSISINNYVSEIGLGARDMFIFKKGLSDDELFLFYRLEEELDSVRIFQDLRNETVISSEIRKNRALVSFTGRRKLEIPLH